ncbi:MAG: hypothetical protein QM496_10395 [Verrucomicrobiota bacterium]
MNEKQESSIQDQSRRNFFNKLAVAAGGGVLLGAAGMARAADDEKSPLLSDPHTCKGLNTCKGKGAGGKNDCAGQGACATAEKHSCHGHNACKGQGGCGSSAGENSCKGKGECSVPLSKKTWKKARRAFEKEAKKAGIKVGPAPK